MKRLLTLTVFVLGFLLLGSWAFAWADGIETLSTTVAIPAGETVGSVPVLSTEDQTGLQTPLPVPDVALPGQPLPVQPQPVQPEPGQLGPSQPVPVPASGTDDAGASADEAAPAADSSGQEAAVAPTGDQVMAAGTAADTSTAETQQGAPPSSSPTGTQVVTPTTALGLSVTPTTAADGSEKTVVVMDPAGQAEVTYVYTVTNLGNVSLDQVTVVDGLLGTVALADSSLDPGESAIGRASYRVTPADLQRGQIVNRSIAQGIGPSGEMVQSDPVERAVLVMAPPAAPAAAPVAPQPDPQVLSGVLQPTAPSADDLAAAQAAVVPQGPLPRTGPATGMGARTTLAGMLLGAALVLSRRFRQPRDARR